MTVFGNEKNIRGCFTVFTWNTSAGRGAVLRLPTGNLPETDYSDPLFVIGFNYQQADVASFVKTFNDKVYTYAFGHDPRSSVMGVHFIGLLVNKTKYSEVVEKVNRKYKDARVTKSKKYATLGLGSAKPLRGFVTGMQSTTEDPETGLQRFTVSLALVEPQ